MATKSAWWWPPAHPRTWAAMAGAVLLVALATGVGVYLSHLDRGGRHSGFGAGATGAPDRVDIVATINRVEAARNDAQVRVFVTLVGKYAKDGDEVFPAQDVTIETSSLSSGELTYPAGKRVVSKDMLMDLPGGDIADYPFDRYSTTLAFSATVGGRPAPIAVAVVDSDPGFVTRAAENGDPEEPGFDLQLRRTRGTFAMVWLMYVIMWALALSVLTGALVMARRSLGMVWPGLGWMAASLFALAGYRNTAPGQPPIGCLLDYTVFLWAEAIVAFSMVYAVLRGTRVEMRVLEEG
ncbi:DUF4436 family protein [Catenulispora sp. NF23]|uniref:DUF4436 family protein n=1 Tax=Catenulispora pinistramenti TaxID=2705254 RepID=A0ABS5KWG7_9ACTN|nr:DUF4436 family protein [Catenulispora pinistramenti]MBS2537756.1 DUF4436 family protein [Catenulispora pinistramenti]MBS2550339.1 DUF4436 family protein [Catenulispora pinistramenti]